MAETPEKTPRTPSKNDQLMGWVVVVFALVTGSLLVAQLVQSLSEILSMGAL